MPQTTGNRMVIAKEIVRFILPGSNANCRASRPLSQSPQEFSKTFSLGRRQPRIAAGRPVHAGRFVPPAPFEMDRAEQRVRVGVGHVPTDHVLEDFHGFIRLPPLMQVEGIGVAVLALFGAATGRPCGTIAATRWAGPRPASRRDCTRRPRNWDRSPGSCERPVPRPSGVSSRPEASQGSGERPDCSDPGRWPGATRPPPCRSRPWAL